MQQAAVVILVLLGDLFACSVARLRPGVRGAGQIAAEGGRVEIPLVIR